MVGYCRREEMDRSTQVNFPVVLRGHHSKPRMDRHNTFAELNASTRNLNGSWVQLRPSSSTRPRSLNLSTETFQRSRLTYQSESPISGISSSIPNSDISLNQAPTMNRDKSPPQFPMASFLLVDPRPRQPPKIARGETSSFQSFAVGPQACHCRCRARTSTSSSSPEGLSWRRLHMSRAKLKATATTSELLSGFAMVAMVELQINEPTTVPEWLFVLFAVCTTVLVSVHIFALMISTYILPNIDAISKLDVCELVAESPHERMRGFIELAWAFSTILGLFLFLVEVAILCWVKFWDYSFTAAIASTVIVIPVLVVFILFAVHFYHSLVVYRCDTSTTDMEKLEDMKRQLDQITTPV